MNDRQNDDLLFFSNENSPTINNISHYIELNCDKLILPICAYLHCSLIGKQKYLFIYIPKYIYINITNHIYSSFIWIL